MTNQRAGSARLAEMQHRAARIGGMLLGVLGLFLLFVGGALALLGFGLVWRMRR